MKGWRDEFVSSLNIVSGCHSFTVISDPPPSWVFSSPLLGQPTQHPESGVSGGGCVRVPLIITFLYEIIIFESLKM